MRWTHTLAGHGPRSSIVAVLPLHDALSEGLLDSAQHLMEEGTEAVGPTVRSRLPLGVRLRLVAADLVERVESLSAGVRRRAG